VRVPYRYGNAIPGPRLLEESGFRELLRLRNERIITVAVRGQGRRCPPASSHGRRPSVNPAGPAAIG